MNKTRILVCAMVTLTTTGWVAGDRGGRAPVQQPERKGLFGGGGGNSEPEGRQPIQDNGRKPTGKKTVASEAVTYSGRQTTIRRELAGEVAELIKKLQTPIIIVGDAGREAWVKERLAALEALAKLAPVEQAKAVPELLRTQYGNDLRLYQQVEKMLAAMQDAKIDMLERTAKEDSEICIRGKAIENLNERSLEVILALCKDPHWHVRSAAVSRLQVAPPASRAPAMEALRDEHPAVRTAAIDALRDGGRKTPPEWAAAIAAVLQDEEPQVSDWAFQWMVSHKESALTVKAQITAALGKGFGSRQAPALEGMGIVATATSAPRLKLLESADPVERRRGCQDASADPSTSYELVPTLLRMASTDPEEGLSLIAFNACQKVLETSERSAEQSEEDANRHWGMLMSAYLMKHLSAEVRVLVTRMIDGAMRGRCKGELSMPAAVLGRFLACAEQSSRVVNYQAEHGDAATLMELVACLGNNAAADMRERVLQSFRERHAGCDRLRAAALKHKDPVIRRRAMSSIQDDVGPLTVAALVGLLKDADVDMRASAAERLWWLSIGTKSLQGGIPVEVQSGLKAACNDVDVFTQKTTKSLELRLAGKPETPTQPAPPGSPQRAAEDQKWLGVLADPKQSGRSRALALSQLSLGRTTKETLLKMLKDKEPEARLAAIRAMNQFTTGRADSAVWSAMAQVVRFDPEERVRNDAKRMCDYDDSWKEVEAKIKSLKPGAAGNTLVLADALLHWNLNVRQAAMNALTPADLKSASIYSALQQGLSDRDDYSAYETIVALAGDARSVELLPRMIERAWMMTPQNSQRLGLRDRMLAVIGQLASKAGAGGPPIALPKEVLVVVDRGWGWGFSDAMRFVQKLGPSGRAVLPSILRIASEGEPWEFPMTGCTLRALGENARPAVAELLKLSGSDNVAVRMSAAQALAGVTTVSVEAEQRMHVLQKDPNARVRVVAEIAVKGVAYNNP